MTEIAEIERLRRRVADLEKRHERLAIAQYNRTHDRELCESCGKRIAHDDDGRVGTEDGAFCGACVADMQP